MKIISPELNAHLTLEVTTLASCFKLKCKDGTVMGFTSHDQDISFAGVIYKADSGFTPSAISSNSELTVDNLEINGMISSVAITDEDLHSGLYDFAEIEIFIINYKNLAQGKLILSLGTIGEMKFSRNNFIAEIRGLTQSLSQKIGELYSPLCRANFADNRCKVKAQIFYGAVTDVISNSQFMVDELLETDGYFDFGTLSFLSGSNKNIDFEIKNYNSKIIGLILPAPHTIQVGDKYSLSTGCDKSFACCTGKYNNAINFRAEPHLPGMEQILGGEAW